MLRHSLAFGATLVLLTVSATAQAPIPAASTLDVTLDQENATIELGSDSTVKVTVSFSSMGFVCPSAGEASINLRLEASGLAGVSGTIDPGTIRLVVPAGAYLNAAFTASGEAMLKVTVAKNSLPSHDHSFTVTGTFDGNAPQGCTAVADTQSAEDVVEFKIKTGTLSPSASGTGAPAGSGVSSSGTSTAKGTPGASAALILVGLASIAMLARRRGH